MLPSRSASQPEPEPRFVARLAWSLGQRIGFRFLFSYLALYMFPFQIGYIAGTDWLSTILGKPWIALVLWFSRHVLHPTRPIQHIEHNGSGDSTFDYLG